MKYKRTFGTAVRITSKRNRNKCHYATSKLHKTKYMASLRTLKYCLHKLLYFTRELHRPPKARTDASSVLQLNHV